MARDQEVILIAAVAEKNRVIGNALDLPWHIPEDLKRFKRLTIGHPLVMGRTTFDAIVHQFGGPLPNRRNIVLSRRGAPPEYPDIETYGSIPDLMAALRDEPVIYIGGGGDVYRQFMPLATKLELTLVEGDFGGDTFFPPYQHLLDGEFAEEESDESSPDEDRFRFVTYRRQCGRPLSS